MKKTHRFVSFAAGLLLAGTQFAFAQAGLVNGNFENGFEGWTQNGGVWLQNPALEGEYSCGFIATEELTQDFAATPGQTYMVAFETAQCGYWVCSSLDFAVRAGQTELSLTGYASDIQGPEGFKYHARSFYQFTAPAGVTNLTLVFEYQAVDDNWRCDGYYVLDNVSVHSVLLNDQPDSQYAVAIGGNLTMNVAASGSALSYQWKKDGIAIPGATGTALALSNLQQANSGTYTVVVSNASDSVETAPAVLKVAGAFVNGDFENGLAGWNGTSGIWLFEPPLQGNASLSFNYLDDRVSQTFAVTPGATYTLQYDFAEYGMASGSQVYSEVTSGVRYLDVSSTSTPIVGPGDYTEHVRVAGQFTVPPGVTAVTLTFYNASWPAASSWPVIDSVSVQ